MANNTTTETNTTGGAKTTETTTPSQTEQVKSNPADAERRAAAALEFGKIQHTYRPIPQGFMGYGNSGAWD
jgi:hypothetical protein